MPKINNLKITKIIHNYSFIIISIVIWVKRKKGLIISDSLFVLIVSLIIINTMIVSHENEILFKVIYFTLDIVLLLSYSFCLNYNIKCWKIKYARNKQPYKIICILCYSFINNCFGLSHNIFYVITEPGAKVKQLSISIFNYHVFR